ncbi:MAG: response regulator [Burkholderiales bacterium]|nr:response regulator [Burkholderiales bacterium]
MQPSTDDTPLPQPSVLLVDDEPSVLSALRRLLRPQGYQLLQATSGADALEMLKDEPVDLIISDMRMPGMDGAQFLEASRVMAPEAVRILLTGYADINATINAINRGELHRYIQKPWDDNDLVLLVKEALSRRALEQRNLVLANENARQNAELKELNATLEARVQARTAEIGQINDMLETAYEELNEQFMLAVQVFTSLLEARANRIAGHSRRVGALAQRTAVRLGLAGRALQDVHLAALLHDIGKIGFPDRMFSKPVSTYDAAEQVIYRKHPLDGEAALMALDKLHGVALMVRQHHERWDGRGFPDGLAGDAIEIGARIVAVISDYDGLISGDLGQAAIEPPAAVATVQSLSGQRYDPRVVAAFIEALNDEVREAQKDEEIDAMDLQPGMVLSRDLVSKSGSVLLTAGFNFDNRVIRQVTEFARRENLHLKLHVRSSSIRRRSARPTATASAPT